MNDILSACNSGNMSWFHFPAILIGWTEFAIDYLFYWKEQVHIDISYLRFH